MLPVLSQPSQPSFATVQADKPLELWSGLDNVTKRNRKRHLPARCVLRKDAANEATAVLKDQRLNCSARFDAPGRPAERPIRMRRPHWSHRCSYPEVNAFTSNRTGRPCALAMQLRRAA